MATEQRRPNVHQQSQGGFLIFLTICFTLCGAGACEPLGGGSSGPKKWTEFVEKGNIALKAGDYAEAEKDFEGGEKACAKEFGKDDPRRATCLGYLAQMYREQQEYRKAAIVYKELIEIDEKTDPKSADLVQFRAQYAEIQKKIKDYHLDTDPNAPVTAKPKTEKKDAKTEGKKEAKPAAKKH